MKQFLSTLIFFIPFLCLAQTPAKTANEAFVLTKMVAKFHVSPRNINDSFSLDVYNQMLEKTDESKVLFTKDDIAKFAPYATLIDDEIKQKNADFLTLFTTVYVQRLKQADSLAGVVSAKPFNLLLNETFTVAEDTSYPATLAAAQQKLYKVFKMNVLDDMTDDLPDGYKLFTPAQQKKYVDSAEAVYRKKNLAAYKRRISNMLQNPAGITQYIGELYCETIATCFDPHTEYLPKTDKENLEGELGKQRFRFGFSLEEDKDGGVLIDKLKPGSPAFKCGKLNKGDKFLAVQWAGKQAIDVSGSTPSELSAMISHSNHDTLYFTMRKAGGSVVQVALAKEQETTGDDENKVKSFILKGANAIGYIYLPAFYEDWESSTANNGCANDVAKEIVKLKQEGIDGLIIDLRYNGGGSASEATALAGIFIDAGPVAQDKGKEPKVFTMKDVDRGTIYDGPLVIMVNGYSASASELVAGTLQDYNRAVIVGTPTYGKATAQVIFPMDTTVTYQNFTSKQTDNDIKITVSKLYRVNGTTAQFKGVQPDIYLPDVLSAYITKEADEPFALQPNTIDANKYYQPNTPLPIATLAAGVKQQVDTSGYFTRVQQFITAYKQQKAAKDVLLTLPGFISNVAVTDMENSPVKTRVVTTKFAVQNNKFEITRLQTDGYLKQLNDDFKEQISKDPYIGVAYDVLRQLKK